MIHGTANRKKAERYGLKVNVCLECHQRIHLHDRDMDLKLMETAQSEFEKTHTRKEWMAEFGKNWREADMVEIKMTTNLEKDKCIATLSCALQNGFTHEKSYYCERMAADSDQRAELKAVAVGLNEIKCPAKVKIYLSSKHTIAAINQDWPTGWKRNDWKTAKGKLARDWEIWKKILEIAEQKELILSAGGKHEKTEK